MLETGRRLVLCVYVVMLRGREGGGRGAGERWIGTDLRGGAAVQMFVVSAFETWKAKKLGQA